MEGKMKYLIEATDKYIKEQISDKELSLEKGIAGYKPKKGEQWEVDEDRKNLLIKEGFAKVVEKEKIKEESKKESKAKKKTNKNTKKEE
jgi:hypothetical protein